MKASILTIGDELLIGQVLNSNVQWISERLTSIGVTVTRHLSVGDEMEEITGALRFLQSSCDILIIGGGLGPTHDDLTVEALSRYFKIPLRYDEEWVSKIEEFFKSRGRPMTENNRKQGYLLRDAERIDNDCGTAPGQFLMEGRTRIFVVPGVPHEMKSMMERVILPKLLSEPSLGSTRILKETLLTSGVGESALAQRIQMDVERIRNIPGMSLAFLPSNTGVRLRLQMRASTPEEEASFRSEFAALEKACGPDAYGVEPDTLEECVHRLLIGRGETLAIAESCTGGLVSQRLTRIAGTSKILRGTLIPYQTDLKTRELGIPPTLFEQSGVVSEASARAMAESIRTKWGTTWGLGITGYLGPEGDAFAPGGTVWIAVACGNQTLAREFHFENHRERAQERAAVYALDSLRRALS
jgi:nicotinamide-nucleotide amidase